MSTNTRTKRFATHATIVALAFATASIGAPSTFAAQNAGDDESNTPQVASINSNADVSLTINKRLNADRFNEPTGNVDNDVDGDQLQGVKYRVQKINADITTAEGFKKAADMTPAEAADAVGEFSVEKTTDQEGSIVFSNDDLNGVGAYLVTETEAPEGVVKADPFIVFLPMTNPANLSEWNYNVVAYPKNTQNKKVTKKIIDGEEANAGDMVKFEISTERPSFNPDKSYLSYFSVVDELPAVFKYDVDGANQAVVKIGETPLEKGTDYNILVEQTEGGLQKVSVVFTNGGLIKLKNAGAKSKVSVELPVEVLSNKESGSTDGKGDNTGTVIFKINKKSTPGGSVDTDDPENPENNPGDTPDEPENPNVVPSDPVTSRWADIQINKVSDGNKEKLQGAVFELFRCTDKNTFTSDKLTVNGQNSWTTAGEEGTVTISSVRVPDAGEYKYCLKEITAPSGYELLVEPVVVDVTTVAENANTVEKEVTNIKSTSSKLPETGGVGVGLLMALGASILGAGAFAAKRASRKTQ
ncbi:SpaH/EbpB family LPXTG-anchored major pilin [Corynebacterium sp. CCM 9203]|uniref:SpaH/EbpB family LPXTG-anchored major pilin n=1 Tax=Corynebacterium sp. CCM 9203 TaxID=3057615 RepID=UPI003524659A